MRFYDHVNDEVYELDDDIPTREIQVLILIAEGRGTREELAQELGISVASARDYVGRLCRRFGCKKRELPATVLGFSATEEDDDTDFGRILRAMTLGVRPSENREEE